MNAVDKSNYSMPEIPDVTGFITWTNTPNVEESYARQYGKICVVRIQAVWGADQSGALCTIGGIPIPSASFYAPGVVGNSEVGVGILSNSGVVFAVSPSGTPVRSVDVTFVYPV